jgi:uncharacterized protein (TIGR00661 family)
MKILYAVQATGNGHISRAMEILPYLERYGQIDIFLSGANHTLDLDSPVKFRSKGLCLFYNAAGGLDYLRTMRSLAPLRMTKEIRELPVENYDLVLNDFESITSLACAYKKVPSVNFGHQASFQSERVPRPTKKDHFGEWVLRHYARASQYIGLHFQSYDDFILPPVIRQDVQRADPSDQGHITVYLSSYSDQELTKYLAPLRCFRFQVFSHQVNQPVQVGNIQFIPVGKAAFNQSLVHCTAIITGAGFETPAEALYLGKKLMVIPIKGQYEQLCNAAALEQMGVQTLPALDAHFARAFAVWMNDPKRPQLVPDHSTEAIIDFLMQHAAKGQKIPMDLSFPELVF